MAFQCQKWCLNAKNYVSLIYRFIKHFWHLKCQKAAFLLLKLAFKMTKMAFNFYITDPSNNVKKIILLTRPDSTLKSSCRLALTSSKTCKDVSINGQNTNTSTISWSVGLMSVKQILKRSILEDRLKKKFNNWTNFR